MLLGWVDGSAKAKQNMLLLWDMAQLQVLRDHLGDVGTKQKLIKEADKAVKRSAESVTEKKVTPFVSDVHYYVSTAPYWWPDTLQDGSVKYVRIDGKINPNRIGNDNERFSRLSQALKCLAQAFFITNDDKYRNAFLQRLHKWFIDVKTRMYPNLDYAQVVPGQGGNKGRQYGIVEIDAMNDILDSFRLMCQLNGIDKKTKRSFRRWCENMMTWLRYSENGKAESLATGNISTIYDVTLFNLAVFCGEMEIADSITNAFAASRLERQIMSDGTQPVELVRTRGFGYSVANLTHFVDFCVMQERLGRHYYAEHRDIINSAVNYLLQFVGNRKAFPYQEIGNWGRYEDILKEQQSRLKALK